MSHSIETDVHEGRLPLARLVGGMLADLAAHIDRVPPELWGSRGRSLGPATLGQHARHCLDHAAALVRGVAEGVVDYDRRERSTRTESDPTHAAVVARELAAAFEDLVDRVAPERALEVHAACGTDHEECAQPSSFGRELQFLVSHTVHHLAMIAAICREHGVAVAADFGVAPSTLRHRRATGG